MDKFANHLKNILHGFFLTLGTTVAEPSTILPLIVQHFGGSPVLIGFFSALQRGGAVLMQLFAAYKAQHYARMLPYLRRVFLVRFLSWFFIGVAVMGLGESHPTLTLWAIGVGLFLFSFSAGFGAIYFREIVAKIFTHRFRGKTMAWRQFFSGLGALLGGGMAAWILERFPAPDNYGYLFIFSAFLMGLGLTAFATVEEPVKRHFETKIESFGAFLRHALELLKTDRQLQVQIVVFLLAYGYLVAMPFIILDAKETIHLGGKEVGLLITAQMVGAMLSNALWGRLGSRGRYKTVALISITLKLAAILLTLWSHTLWHYGAVFFLLGAAGDGSRIASSNLILILAPPAKRPLYVAVQMNIVSLGMFFPILGGALLHFLSYHALYGLTAAILTVSLLLATRLNDDGATENKKRET